MRAGATLDEHGMVWEELTVKLEVMGPGEGVEARGGCVGQPSQQCTRTDSGRCSVWTWISSRGWPGKGWTRMRGGFVGARQTCSVYSYFVF